MGFRATREPNNHVRPPSQLLGWSIDAEAGDNKGTKGPTEKQGRQTRPEGDDSKKNRGHCLMLQCQPGHTGTGQASLGVPGWQPPLGEKEDFNIFPPWPSDCPSRSFLMTPGPPEGIRALVRTELV